MPQSVDLSVIIPVHNDESSIEQLVRDFVSVDGLTTDVTLVDDCSADGSAALIRELAEEFDNVNAKFHRRNRGAGVARNTGFADAVGRFTIFFDADDHLHPDALGHAVARLDDTEADTAVMPYRYRRGGSSHEAMNRVDCEIWDAYIRASARTPEALPLDELPRLLGFSNYPWNKVIRTAHFQALGLRFGATPVHNDILGHWYSLLFARTVVLVDHEVCTHVVETGGKNLSNRHSEVRLALFDALDETYDLLEGHPALRNRYSHHYWASVIRVAEWAQMRIEHEFIDEFRLRLQEHLHRVNLSDFTRIRLKRDPALADMLLQRSLS